MGVCPVGCRVGPPGIEIIPANPICMEAHKNLDLGNFEDGSVLWELHLILQFL